MKLGSRRDRRLDESRRWSRCFIISPNCAKYQCRCWRGNTRYVLHAIVINHLPARVRNGKTKRGGGWGREHMSAQQLSVTKGHLSLTLLVNNNNNPLHRGHVPLIERGFLFQKVGCDLRVGSNKNTDACGVCGGNGSSCQSRYFWALESISACTKSCGGGQ